MSFKKKIRVLVVEDSMLFREVLSNGLEKHIDIEIVGKAGDPYEARDKIIKLRPDVMTLDIEMPKMNGIDFLKKLIPQYPIPTVVVSSEKIKAFEAVKAGAVEFVRKPMVKSPHDMEEFLEELVLKVRIASEAKIVKLAGRKGFEKSNMTEKLESKRKFTKGLISKKNAIIAIGASTGGTDAINAVVRDFPEDTPGVVIVQHMPPIFTKMYAERLDNSCRMKVKEAENGDIVETGKVLVAPGGFHMKIVRFGDRYKVKIFEGEKVNGHCPSVDVLFNSVAEQAGGSGIGIILTGMGTDGAKGMLKMKRIGAYTIGQDEATCVVYGMPKVAFNIGAVAEQNPLLEIPKTVLNCLRR